MMTWEMIRAYYATLLAQSGRTQQAVARSGDLSGQNAISKLLANTKRGPSVETFVKAVLGLDIPLSTFFAALEQGHTSAPESSIHDRSIQDRLRLIEDQMARLPLSPLPLSPERTHAHTTSSPPPAGNVVYVSFLDEHRIAAIVHTVFAELAQHIDRLARDVGSAVDARPDAHSADPAHRVPHRERTR